MKGVKYQAEKAGNDRIIKSPNHCCPGKKKGEGSKMILSLANL
jgi:hypothetical protein